jgi:hypothetical protein
VLFHVPSDLKHLATWIRTRILLCNHAVPLPTVRWPITHVLPTLREPITHIWIADMLSQRCTSRSHMFFLVIWITAFLRVSWYWYLRNPAHNSRGILWVKTWSGRMVSPKGTLLFYTVRGTVNTLWVASSEWILFWTTFYVCSCKVRLRIVEPTARQQEAIRRRNLKEATTKKSINFKYEINREIAINLISSTQNRE